MPERSADWFKQAEKDLENSVWEKKGGFYDWACFVAQQASEKAIKAVYQRLGGVAWGHSVVKLLEGLQEKIDIEKEIFEAARLLDRFYIPARYPNGWDSGAPYEYFTERDAEEAISAAKKILGFCKDLLAR